MKHAARYIYIALATLLGTACSDTANTLFTPGEQPIHEMEIGFSVSETEWEGQTVSMTRSGETLEALEAKGFGVFCKALAMTNQEVTWDTITGTWDYGTKILWPKGVVDDLRRANPSEIFVYAPYDGSVELATDGKSIAADNTKDWLWASPEISPDGTIHLDFKHALAELSFGTITNNHGHPITLKSVTIKGDAYTNGALSLAGGTWSNWGNPISPIDPIKPIDPNEEDEEPIEIQNGETKPFGIKTMTLIPHQKENQKIEVEIVVEVTEAPNGSAIIKTDKTIKKEITLEQGKNTEINLTVGQNHEVVIK